ncbi:MAG: hypothetical protein ACREO2_02675, partial [Arenimonas sp.]
PGTVFETEHYAISSTAKSEQAVQVAAAVESFYSAYSVFFEKEIAANRSPAKLKMMLYRDRQEFATNNTSSSWAEAYYRAPVCYAYFSDTAENPYHWMIHEATHQLNNELSGFKIPKWINEGLATYFGSSRIENAVLLPGKVDDTAYPIWWLSSLPLSGNLQSDIDNGRIIPLRALISGKGGPDINQNVNLYYIEYWSFTHFLFHYESGRYAESYKKLIRQGGSLADFESIVGPIERIQTEWYKYLQMKVTDADGELVPEIYDSIEVSI